MIHINALLAIYAQVDQRHLLLYLVVESSAVLVNTANEELLLKLSARKEPIIHMRARHRAQLAQQVDFVQQKASLAFRIVLWVNTA